MNILFRQLVFLFALAAGSFSGLVFPVFAEDHQPADPPPHPLVNAQVLLIESVALTERGIQDASSIEKTVSDKLVKAGYTVVSSPDQPHDAVVRVKCEERKTWTGPSKHRSIGPAPTSRLWKGPACLLTYRYKNRAPHWNWEVRTEFEDLRAAAKSAGAPQLGAFALDALNVQLQRDDFPLYLAAEWEQTDRLLMLLQNSADNVEKQKIILHLLGTLPSEKAFEALKAALLNPALTETALAALGQQGEKAIPALASCLETDNSPDHRLAAIEALGAIATQSKNPALFTQFMNLLDSEDAKIQTEAVKGLGNLGDRRAIQALEKLNLQAWTNPSSSSDMQALREMLSWSLWQLNPDAHTGG